MKFALAVDKGVSGDAISNLAHMEPCISSTTADGKACSYANCGFVTTVTVPSGVELDEEYQWLQLQRQELTKHCTRVHNTGNLSTSTDDVAEQTTVGHHEHGDGTIVAAYKAPRNSCTSRSKKSRKRTKSRKYDDNYSGTIWDMLC